MFTALRRVDKLRPQLDVIAGINMYQPHALYRIISVDIIKGSNFRLIKIESSNGQKYTFELDRDDLVNVANIALPTK